MKEWLKGLGKAAVDAGKAKLDDTRGRLMEPPLSPTETASYDRYRALSHLARGDLERGGMPPCPAEESLLTRRDIRTLLQHPEFLQALEKGRAIDVEWKQQRVAEEDARFRAQEARKAAEEERLKAEQKARLPNLKAFYDNELNPIVVRLSAVRPLLSDQDFRLFAADNVERHDMNPKSGHAPGLQGFALNLVLDASLAKGVGTAMETAFASGYLQRTLRDFNEAERGALRLGAILHELGKMSAWDLTKLQLSLIWNEGRTAIQGLPNRFDKLSEKKVFTEGFGDLIVSRFGSPETAVEEVQERCRRLLASSDNPALQEALMENLFSGAQWLTASRAKGLAEHGETASALRLGQFVDGSGELLYDMNAPVITIAQPGSGKSQAHSLRNLLTLKAPAVVLDVKDRELFDNSAGWRAANVGPVYRFDPQHADGSIRFNPLDFIDADDPETAYEQAGKIAELLTVPPEKGDYFDERGTQVIMGAVLDVALREVGDRRNMQAVLDRVSGVDTTDLDATKDFFQDFVAELQMSDLSPLRRMGKSLHKLIGSDQLRGIMDTAVKALGAWEPPRIARLTASTTFSPERLRDENATLYLCVNQGNVKGYAAVLRVILGITLAYLCERKPKAGDLPVTFILDEVARLRRMSIIEDASDIGRGYKVRLWLFIQNMGQLASEYPNADGLLKNCLARCYLSPDEDTAQWLSANLGTRHGLIDGSKHPLVEPHTLTGPEYRDRMIVMLNGYDNARLSKVLADKTPELQERMAVPVPAGG